MSAAGTDELKAKLQSLLEFSKVLSAELYFSVELREQGASDTERSKIDRRRLEYS